MNFLRSIPLVISFSHVLLSFPIIYLMAQSRIETAFLLFLAVFLLTFANELAGRIADYWTPFSRYVQIISTRFFIISLLFTLWWYDQINGIFLTILLARDFVVVVLVIFMHCQSPVPLYVGNENLSSRLYFLTVFLLELVVLAELSFSAITVYFAPVAYSSFITWFSYFIILVAVVSGIDLVFTKLRVTNIGWPLH